MNVCWCPLSLEEDTGFPKTRVTGVYDLPGVSTWALNSVPLQEQQVF